MQTPTATHTAGPWRITEASAGIYDNTDDDICDVVGIGPSGEEIKLAQDVEIHDARLIAAAPEMLAVVQRLLAEEADGHITIGLIEDARAAIAKAEGRS